MENERRSSLTISFRASLHSLAERGKIAPMRRLLSQGVYVNSLNCRKRTALHLAAIKGNVTVVNCLLREGAYVNCRDIEGYTPLHLTIMSGHVSVMKRLVLTQNIEIDCHDNALNTPLHLAALSGNANMLNCLLAYEADVNATNNDGDTPLHLACALGHPYIVRRLIIYGAQVNKKAKRIWLPIHCTILGKWYFNIKKSTGCQVPQWELTRIQIAHRLKIIDTLVTAKAELNFSLTPSPLHLSVHTSLSQKLIKLKADVNAPDDLGRRPIHYATERDIPELIGLLVNNEAQINSKAYDNNTALHLAVIDNNVMMASVLISKGANVNELAHNDTPIILLRSKRGMMKWSLFHLLIESGVDMNMQLPTGYSALLQFFSRQYYNDYTHACLLDQFLDLNTMDKQNHTPLVFTQKHAKGKKNTNEFIIKLIAKMESTSNFEMNNINSDRVAAKYNELYRKCKAELELLKDSNIFGDKYLYNFLVQPLKQLIAYSRNLKVKRAIISTVCEKFPLYGNLIKCRIYIARARQKLLESCLINLHEFAKPYRLNSDAGLYILSYLNLSELYVLHFSLP